MVNKIKDSLDVIIPYICERSVVTNEVKDSASRQTNEVSDLTNTSAFRLCRFFHTNFQSFFLESTDK